MKNINIVIIIIACGCVAAFTAYLLANNPRKDHSNIVGAMRHDHSLLDSSRIILNNDGGFKLSHINVDYGNKNENVNLLNLLKRSHFPLQRQVI